MINFRLSTFVVRKEEWSLTIKASECSNVKPDIVDLEIVHLLRLQML